MLGGKLRVADVAVTPLIVDGERRRTARRYFNDPYVEPNRGIVSDKNARRETYTAGEPVGYQTVTTRRSKVTNCHVSEMLKDEKPIVTMYFLLCENK